MTEQTNPVGRPKGKDKEALEAILKNEESQQKFKASIQHLVGVKRQIMNDQEAFKEDVTAVSEDYKLSKGLINKIVTASAKYKESELLEESVSLADLAEIILGAGDE